eukprot:2233923-Rhodomonas_salina.1
MAAGVCRWHHQRHGETKRRRQNAAHACCRRSELGNCRCDRADRIGIHMGGGRSVDQPCLCPSIRSSSKG